MEAMNSIFKTKNGKYIDLSKIVSISPPSMGVYGSGGNYIHLLVHFQLHEKPVDLCNYFTISFQPDIENNGEPAEIFHEVVSAWKKFKGEAGELKSAWN